MKQFGLICLILSGSAFAADLTCTTNAFKGDEVVKAQVRIRGDQFEVGKLSTGKILEEITAPIDGVAIAKCIEASPLEEKAKIFKCVKALIPNSPSKNDSILSLHKMPVHIRIVQSTTVEVWDLIELPIKEEFDISKIASGTLQVMRFGGNYPNLGIYEFKDASGNLMGRFYHHVLPTLCK